MTVKDLAQSNSGSMNIEVQKDGETILVFSAEYYKYIVDTILDLEVGNYAVKPELFGKSTAVVTVTDEIDDSDEAEAITDDEIDAICQ